MTKTKLRESLNTAEHDGSDNYDSVTSDNTALALMTESELEAYESTFLRTIYMA